MDKDNYNFQKLTPIKNMKLKIYEEALDFVFEDKEIKNVAISGPYSSGKSSVIETYKSKHPNISMLHISLAHFNSNNNMVKPDNSKLVKADTTKDPKERSPNDHIESIIEGKILNQLIHQIEPSKIPKTNFKIKSETSSKDIKKIVIGIMVFLMLSSYIFLYDEWRLFVHTMVPGSIKTLLLVTTDKLSLLLGGVLLANLIGYGLYAIIKFQKDRSIFKRFNFQGSEIEIFEESDDSYFDKYLNEVLYLFKNADVDAIIFEDIDRYDVNRIFERLREVNTLVNNHLLKNGKKAIRFIYLLRDDIFITKDRTKFFDFIIPIIPVVDGSNSYDQFIEHFKNGGIYDLFEENFLQGLSLYIDDMRILKNIYNEFIIYYNQINFPELKSDKLLGLIAYKNIFPKDFSDLQFGTGYVHTLISKRMLFIKDEIVKIENNIGILKDSIRLAKSEILEDIDEIDAVFLVLNQDDIRVNGTPITNFKTRVEAIKAMKSSPDLVTYYGGRYTFNFNSALENLLLNEDYVKRREYIENKHETSIKEIETEIQILQKELTLIQDRKLKGIINKENIDSIFLINYTNEIGDINEFNEIKSSSYFRLIKYLIRNGHIDETYFDYMTYFYENSLSRIDKIFLLSITDQTPKEYDYRLKDPNKVISRLKSSDFYNEEILNFDLLCYLLKTKDENEEFLIQFLNQLYNKDNYKFIQSFIENQEDVELFIRTINNVSPNICRSILDKSEMTDSQIKQYVIYSLYYSPEADLEMLNENNCLTDYISNNPEFLNIEDPHLDRIISGISLIKVKFKFINYATANKKLFVAIYQNNLYKLSFDIIWLMLVAAYGIPVSEDINHKNYTLILSNLDEPLAKYVNDNINDYIRIVIDNSKGCINDDESAVLSIINNTKIIREYREEYMDILRTEIELIEKVDEIDFWGILLRRNLIKYSEENILYYYFNNEKHLDSNIIEFLNSCDKELGFNYDSINNQFGVNSAANFFKSIITCNEISNIKYREILIKFRKVYASFSFKEIDGDKVLILIQVGIIKMNNENLLFMRENYPEQLICFISKNISTYTSEVITEENFLEDEMLSILEEEVDDRFKIEQLKFTTNTISINNKNYANAVKFHILQNNLDITDLPKLIDSYLMERENIEKLIEEILIENIEISISERYELPSKLLTRLIESDKITEDNKIELFAQNLPNMTKLEATEYLSILKMYDYIGLFDMKRPTFEINNINRIILEIFDEKGWITKFEVDKENSKYYRAFGRKTIDKLATELL